MISAKHPSYSRNQQLDSNWNLNVLKQPLSLELSIILICTYKMRTNIFITTKSHETFIKVIGGNDSGVTLPWKIYGS